MSIHYVFDSRSIYSYRADSQLSTLGVQSVAAFGELLAVVFTEKRRGKFDNLIFSFK